MRPASYIGGMYPLIGEPAFPELWNGCIGAWAPCLGPTGLTLRDWGRFGNHGTLTNMDAGTDWIASKGQYALNFDGSNDYIRTTGNGPVSTLTHNTPFTVSLWFSSSSLSGGRNLAIKRIAGSATAFNILTFDASIVFSQFDGSTDRTSSLVGSLTTNRWYHAALVSTGTGLLGYLDGVQIGSSTTSLSPSANSDGLTFGHDPILGRYFSGDLDAMMIHNRILSPNEIRVLASRRGIANELAPRRRARLAAFRAYWATRKAQIIGGGL